MLLILAAVRTFVCRTASQSARSNQPTGRLMASRVQLPAKSSICSPSILPAGRPASYRSTGSEQNLRECDTSEAAIDWRGGQLSWRRPSVSLSVCLSVCQSVYPSINLPREVGKVGKVNIIATATDASDAATLGGNLNLLPASRSTRAH